MYLFLFSSSSPSRMSRMQHGRQENLSLRHSLELEPPRSVEAQQERCSTGGIRRDFNIETGFDFESQQIQVDTAEERPRRRYGRERASERSKNEKRTRRRSGRERASERSKNRGPAKGLDGDSQQTQSCSTASFAHHFGASCAASCAASSCTTSIR